MELCLGSGGRRSTGRNACATGCRKRCGWRFAENGGRGYSGHSHEWLCYGKPGGIAGETPALRKRAKAGGPGEECRRRRGGGGAGRVLGEVAAGHSHEWLCYGKPGGIAGGTPALRKRAKAGGPGEECRRRRGDGGSRRVLGEVAAGHSHEWLCYGKPGGIAGGKAARRKRAKAGRPGEECRRRCRDGGSRRVLGEVAAGHSHEWLCYRKAGGIAGETPALRKRAKAGGPGEECRRRCRDGGSRRVLGEVAAGHSHEWLCYGRLEESPARRRRHARGQRREGGEKDGGGGAGMGDGGECWARLQPGTAMSGCATEGWRNRRRDAGATKKGKGGRAGRRMQEAVQRWRLAESAGRGCSRAQP